MTKCALVVLVHDSPEILKEMVDNLHHFCPTMDVVLYNAGDDPALGLELNTRHVQPSRRLYYARIIHFFFDLFEWLREHDMPYDYVTNLDSDVMFIRHGFEEYLLALMDGYDYLAQNFSRHTPSNSKWRPFRSLKPELENWYKLLGFSYTNQAFNPGQTFSRQYINRLLSHELFPEIKRLVNANESFTLHEVLFPTLVDFLDLPARSYPVELGSINRYRPYQATTGVVHALLTPNAYFLHPIRRASDDSARRLIRALQSI